MNETTLLLDALRASVSEHRTPDPGVRRALAEVTDPALVRKAGRILAGLRPDGTDLRSVRVAVLATCTVGSFVPLLRACLVGAGVLPTIDAGDYGAFDLTLASAGFASDGDPDVVCCLLEESYFLPKDWSAVDIDGIGRHVETRLADLCGLVAASVGRTSATLVVHTVPFPAELRDAVIGWRDRATLAQIWHRLNAGLLGLAAEHAQVVVVDLVGVLTDSPYPARDDRLHRYADMPYTDGALLALADQIRRVVQARMGLSRKVLALDLDNTLWGGVLGDAGPHGVQLGGLYPGNCYLYLQRTVRRLRQQGVILVLASKNDAALVEQALTDHPDVLLRPDSFSVSAVNWSPKVENLRHAAGSLNLSIQSFAFMDDSAFERGHVLSELPEVAVVAADGDPANLVRTLLSPGLFDVMELTDTDRQRPELYRSRAMRRDFSTGFSSSEGYLHGLGTEVVAEPLTSFAVVRVAQLAARTNQFNLTGVRFDESTTATMGADPEYLVASFTVSDRFGSEGIVGAAWVHRGPLAWRVLNLVLSCRVLGRGIELAIVEWLTRESRRAGVDALQGTFVPSGKNGVAAGFWNTAGFVDGSDGVFTLAVDGAPDLAPAWVTLRERNEVRQ